METQFVREPLMRLSKKVVAALSSQDVQQTIWLPRFVHLVTHAKAPAPDDLLARMARRGATLATMSLRLIDHTRPRPRAIAPLIYRHPVVREVSRPEKATNVFNFGLTVGGGEWRDLWSFQIAFPFLATASSGLAGSKS